jgi:hypothetical protein
MGRTRQTYRDELRRLEEDWQTFRRALREADQETFDRLFAYAQTHAAPSGQQNPIAPFQAAIFSMLLEIESERQALEERVDELEAVLEAADL